MTSADYVSYSVCYEHYAGATVPARKLTPLTTCILMSVDKKRQSKELKNYMLNSLTQYMVLSLYVAHVLFRALRGHRVAIKRQRQL